MDLLSERYADVIIQRALRLREGDVLSINTEEENSELAHLIARKARAITGKGSYIQLIENGKVAETEEAATDYPIAERPTALLYLPTYKSYEKTEEGKLYSAPEIQAYRHLSEPLDNGVVSVPFAVAPIPSEAWSLAIDDETPSLSWHILSDLLGLGEDSYLAESEDAKILIYERDRLNEMGIKSVHIYDEEGTDLELSFLQGSRFATTVAEAKGGRLFVPTIYSSDIYRTADMHSASGYIRATRPFMLFGHAVRSFSARFEGGKLVEFQSDDETAKLISLFLMQDENAGYLSELSLSEESTNASMIDYFALPEWDRMRSLSITLGGPRPGSIDADAASKANDSLVTLSIPIGTDTTTVECTTLDGDSFTIMEDGFIKEEISD